MTHPNTTEPFDRETVNRELAELIDHAREADADIEGAYDVHTAQPDHADYTIEITEVVTHTADGDHRGSSPVD